MPRRGDSRFDELLTSPADGTANAAVVLAVEASEPSLPGYATLTQPLSTAHDPHLPLS